MYLYLVLSREHERGGATITYLELVVVSFIILYISNQVVVQDYYDALDVGVGDVGTVFVFRNS